MRDEGRDADRRAMPVTNPVIDDNDGIDHPYEKDDAEERCKNLSLAQGEIHEWRLCGHLMRSVTREDEDDHRGLRG